MSVCNCFEFIHFHLIFILSLFFYICSTLLNFISKYVVLFSSAISQKRFRVFDLCCFRENQIKKSKNNNLLIFHFINIKYTYLQYKFGFSPEKQSFFSNSLSIVVFIPILLRVKQFSSIRHLWLSFNQQFRCFFFYYFLLFFSFCLWFIDCYYSLYISYFVPISLFFAFIAFHSVYRNAIQVEEEYVNILIRKQSHCNIIIFFHINTTFRCRFIQF